MIEALIIDDEKRARETIKNLLKSYCPEVVVVGEGINVGSGIEKIHELQPDLVFLDIKMPDGSGFDLLSKIGEIDFKVIFITAYEEFAIKAFRFAALDYILKPVNPDELMEAVSKVAKSFEKENFKTQFESFINQYQGKKEKQKKIVLKTSESIHLVEVDSIVHCESDKNYTVFYIYEKPEIIVSRTLKEYEELLSEYGFFRVHQSHLVNLSFIGHFDKRDGGFLVMKDGSKVPVSSRKREYLIEKLNDIGK